MDKTKLELAREFLEQAEENLVIAEEEVDFAQDALDDAKSEYWQCELKIDHWKAEIAKEETLQQKEFERLNPRLFDIKVSNEH